MRLLVFTQKMDSSDDVLGFFHDWMVELSKRVDTLTIICLQKGKCDLPNNVKVFSLGKEHGISKLGIIFNFYKILFKISDSYDKVFVHMNQEYVLLGGWYWNLKKIPLYMWRNHPYGNILTNIAVGLCNKVFCTSSHSYTAKFKRTSIMPAGINTEMFKPVQGVVRKKYSVCMIGRISPVKNNYLALEALRELLNIDDQVTLSFIGSYIDRDKEYYESVREFVNKNNLSSKVTFSGGVEPSKLPEIYSSYEICLNLSDSGSFDKTIVESSSCGALPVVSNSSLKGRLPDSCITGVEPKIIAESIRKMLLPHERIAIQKDLEKFVESQSLNNLLSKLLNEINNVQK